MKRNDNIEEVFNANGNSSILCLKSPFLLIFLCRKYKVTSAELS